MKPECLDKFVVVAGRPHHTLWRIQAWDYAECPREVRSDPPPAGKKNPRERRTIRRCKAFHTQGIPEKRGLLLARARTEK